MRTSPIAIVQPTGRQSTWATVELRHQHRTKQTMLVCVPALLLATTALTLESAPKNASKPLTLLKAPHARCMDGTQSGYYFHRSANKAQTKWVLTLQGGGECASSKCEAKVQTALASSKYFPKEYKFWDEAKVHLADVSCTANPVLW